MVWSQFFIVVQFDVHFGNSVLNNSNWEKISHSLTKKLQPCEEGAAHLRISFWHLLMNFEKPKKLLLKKWKNLLEISSCYTCTKNHNHTRYSSRDKKWDGIFCYIGSFFTLLTPSPLRTQETKILKKYKKHLEMSSFLTCATKSRIIWCMLTKIWSAHTDTILCHFRSFLRCHHFTQVYQNLLYCSRDVVRDGCNCLIFIYAIFSRFTPLQPKNWKCQKNEINSLRYHHLTQVYQKSWSYVILLLRYGTWQM